MGESGRVLVHDRPAGGSAGERVPDGFEGEEVRDGMVVYSEKRLLDRESQLSNAKRRHEHKAL